MRIRPSQQCSEVRVQCAIIVIVILFIVLIITKSANTTTKPTTDRVRSQYTLHYVKLNLCYYYKRYDSNNLSWFAV